MSSQSLNEILIKSSTELFDFIYAAYYFTASYLFTFVCEGTMHTEFNSVVLFTVPYWRFQHCAKDMFKVTAQHTILEWDLTSFGDLNNREHKNCLTGFILLVHIYNFFFHFSPHWPQTVLQPIAVAVKPLCHMPTPHPLCTEEPHPSLDTSPHLNTRQARDSGSREGVSLLCSPVVVATPRL